MYDWLMKQKVEHPEQFEIEEFLAKRWKSPFALKRKYTLLTQFLCLAAFDQDQSTVLYLSLKGKPEKELIEQVLLHFKDVKILYHGEEPFEIMLQNVRSSSVKRILESSLHPIIEQLFGNTSRQIDSEWYPIRGEFKVKREALEIYEDGAFDEVICKLREYKLTSFVTNVLLNERYRGSNALRYLAHATEHLTLTINENNHIKLITFE